jgi:hypothetical protein
VNDYDSALEELKDALSARSLARRDADAAVRRLNEDRHGGATTRALADDAARKLAAADAAEKRVDRALARARGLTHAARN